MSENKTRKNNAWCTICHEGYWAARPKTSRYCGTGCKSKAYRSRKGVSDDIKNHSINIDEQIDLARIECYSVEAADNLRQIMYQFGRPVFELAIDAVWAALVHCGALRRE